MSRPDSVILLEFNELSPALMDGFIQAGHLPNFQRLRAQSRVYITDAEETAPNLEPWIQWVTVHSGLTYGEHEIFRLGDGHLLEKPRVWDLLSDQGLRVWVCGSMNINYRRPINGCVLPDAWSTGCTPYPDELLPYYRFVQRNVQEYTNDRVPLTKSDYARFVSFMASHGLSAKTAVAITRQLVKERENGDRWKRATILDKLQWDVFRFQYRKLKPNFSTFFLNSTAHFQHMYWRNMDPEPFRIKPTDEEQARYSQAILFGYQEMDKIVEDCLAMAGPRTVVILASALGQQPCLVYEEVGGKTFYRPRDPEHLLSFAGIREPHEYAPVMSEEFHLFMQTEEAAADAEERLNSLTVNGQRAVPVERKGKKVFGGCKIFTKLPEDTMIEVAGSDNAKPFFALFYNVEGKKSGMHHPDGILWMCMPDRVHQEESAKVPLRNVAPTLLDLFDVPKPSHMSGESLAGAPAVRGARAGSTAQNTQPVA